MELLHSFLNESRFTAEDDVDGFGDVKESGGVPLVGCHIVVFVILLAPVALVQGRGGQGLAELVALEARVLRVGVPWALLP